MAAVVSALPFNAMMLSWTLLGAASQRLRAPDIILQLVNGIHCSECRKRKFSSSQQDLHAVVQEGSCMYTYLHVVVQGPTSGLF